MTDFANLCISSLMGMGKDGVLLALDKVPPQEPFFPPFQEVQWGQRSLKDQETDVEGAVGQ